MQKMLQFWSDSQKFRNMFSISSQRALLSFSSSVVWWSRRKITTLIWIPFKAEQSIKLVIQRCRVENKLCRFREHPWIHLQEPPLPSPPSPPYKHTNIYVYMYNYSWPKGKIATSNFIFWWVTLKLVIWVAAKPESILSLLLNCILPRKIKYIILLKFTQIIYFSLTLKEKDDKLMGATVTLCLRLN